MFPFFGDRPIDTVDQTDIIRAMAPIWISRPETARKVFARVRLIFDWAKAGGHRTGDNPCTLARIGLPKQNAKVQHHAALPYKQLPEFMNSLRLSKAATSSRLGLEFT